MNEKLKELYYKEDVIIGSKQNFINLAKKTLNATTKEINEFLSNQELNQVNKKPTRHSNLKITAPPKSFQIDIMFYPVGESHKIILLIVFLNSKKFEFKENGQGPRTPCSLGTAHNFCQGGAPGWV